MTTDSLQSLMSAKVYAEYDRIRKNDGGLNPNIVDSQKGREELAHLLSGVRKKNTSSKADIVLLKALAKIYDNNPKRVANDEVKGTIYENDTFANILSAVGFSNYGYICSTGNDPFTIDTPKEYQSLEKVLKIAKHESAFSSEDLIMYKALLEIASDYAPKIDKPDWWDRLKPKAKQNNEEKPTVTIPFEPKLEKPKEQETKPKIQPKAQETEPKQVKPKEKYPKKVQNNQSEQANRNKNNTGINNSFNNNSGIIIIK